MRSPSLAGAENNPSIQRCRSCFASCARPYPERGCRAFDNITKADFLIHDKPGQTYPVGALLAFPRFLVAILKLATFHRSFHKLGQSREGFPSVCPDKDFRDEKKLGTERVERGTIEGCGSFPRPETAPQKAFRDSVGLARLGGGGRETANSATALRHLSRFPNDEE